jgi:hypothetical protein
MAFSARSQKYKDGGLNRFKKTNLFFETNPYILFQDPTYIGFKLFFLVNQPDSKLLSDQALPNTAMGYLTNIGDTARVHYLQKFVQHLVAINQQTPWFFQSIEGLQDAWKHGYQEADFKPLLPADRKISIKCLESIDLRMTALIDLYRKACFDWPNRREVVPKNLRQFTMYIYCYENRTINVKGQPGSNSLSSLKEYAALPEVNQRQIDQNKIMLGIPLSDPNVAKKIPSIDSIKAGVEGVIGIGQKKTADDGFDNGKQFANNIDNTINRIMFKFDLCEWLPDESGVIGAKVNNITGEPAEQTLSFSYKMVYEENIYNLFSGIGVTDLNYILDQSALDNAEPTLKNLKAKFDEGGGFDMKSVLNGNFNSLKPFASMAADRLTQAVASRAKGLLLGNIYGFSAANVAGAAQSILTGDPSTMVQGISSLTSMGGGASKKNDTQQIEGEPNVFDETSPSQALMKNMQTDLGNAFLGFQPSRANDNGPDSKSQATGNDQASLANDNGPDATSQGKGNDQASLSNG